MEHFTPAKVRMHLNPRNLILIVAGVVALILLIASVFIVGPAERAVVTRFGRYADTRMPGLQFKLPFIERHYIVNIEMVHREQFGFRTARTGSDPVRHLAEATMLTGDLNILEIEWIIQYRISDPRAWLFNVNIPDRIATIRDVSRSVINQLVGDRAIIGIMGSERSAMGVEALNMMNEIFRNYGMGISVHEVVFQNSVPPDRVRPAFEDVNMASQEMRRLISEGMRTYNEVIPRSRGEAQRVVQVARGYAAERVNMARGDVARFNAVLTEYQASPAVTRQRLYYETMEEIFKNSTGKNIIDHRLDNFLPMQNLGR